MSRSCVFHSLHDHISSSSFILFIQVLLNAYSMVMELFYPALASYAACNVFLFMLFTIISRADTADCLRDR